MLSIEAMSTHIISTSFLHPHPAPEPITSRCIVGQSNRQTDHIPLLSLKSETSLPLNHRKLHWSTWNVAGKYCLIISADDQYTGKLHPLPRVEREQVYDITEYQNQRAEHSKRT